MLAEIQTVYSVSEKIYTLNTRTHALARPFFRDYPGEPVPERWNQSGFY